MKNYQNLTNRENEVKDLLILGLTNGQIAKELFISIGTVKTHIKKSINCINFSVVCTYINHYNHHINKLKSKNYMILLIDSEKTLDKIQYPSVIIKKNLSISEIKTCST